MESPLLQLIRSWGDARLVETRFGLRDRGVPVGGAFDEVSATVARAALQLEAQDPIWEIAGSAEFLSTARGTLAIVGFRPQIEGPGFQLRSSRIFVTRQGERLWIRSGGAARVYVAETSRRLQPGVIDVPVAPTPGPIRLVEGPHLTSEQRFKIRAGEFQLTAHSDRRGLRLDPLLSAHEQEIASEPCDFGVLQCTSSGRLVVVGPDGPTLGGYPRLGQVIHADRHRLGQLRIGDPVVFEFLGIDEAVKLAEEHNLYLQHIRAEAAARCLDLGPVSETPS